MTDTRIATDESRRGAADRGAVSRRSFLTQTTASAAAVSLLPGSVLANFDRNDSHGGSNTRSLQEPRELAESFVRSFYEAKDELNAEAFGAHFADPSVYTDAVLFGLCAAPASRQERTSIFQGLFSAIGVPARLSKFVHATGDLRHGVVAEYVDVPGTFYSDAFDLMALLELDNGLVSLDVDYWDSWQLSRNEIVGPAATIARTQKFTPTGPTVDVPVAYSLAPVHADGVPRFIAPCALEPEPSNQRHASPEMLALAGRLNESLSQAHASKLLNMFSDDALLIHPLLHQGPPGYGAFNRGIQLRGKKAITRFFKAVLDIVPDGADSALRKVVGGPSGGGFTWKAGGLFANQGLDRQGIDGITSIDLDADGAKISRMSVKFDTFHVTAEQRKLIHRRMNAYGVPGF